MAEDVNSHMHWWNLHLKDLTAGDLIADKIVNFIGSWKFIIAQSGIFVVWVLVNTLTLFGAIHFDPYPFILFNLFMSAEAAYSSPLIMMCQNRQASRDRHQAEVDYQTTLQAKEEIEQLQLSLSRIETEKLDQIITLIQGHNERISKTEDAIRHADYRRKFEGINGNY